MIYPCPRCNGSVEPTQIGLQCVDCGLVVYEKEQVEATDE